MTAPAASPTTYDDAPDADTWTRVCLVSQIDVEGGVTALVAGRAVAVFRTHDDEIYALDNFDPFSSASVIARGIQGTRTVEGETVPYVASPIYKQGFDLRSGQCLDDAGVRLATWSVRVVETPEGPAVDVGAEQRAGA